MRSIQTLNDSYPIDKNGEIVPPITTSNGSGIWDFKQKTTLQDILSMEVTDADREREIHYQNWKSKQH